MKAMRILIVTCAVLVAMSSVAWADLILIGGTPANSFTDLGAQGFGNAPRMLTLQTNDYESGYVTPVDVVNDDAISGANKSTTPTLSALGWTSGDQVGIGFNSNQAGTQGITMQELWLTIYNGMTTIVGTFSLASPVDFTQADLDLQQGNGNSVFNFGLNLAEQAQFDAILAQPGSSGFYAALGSSLGCEDSAPGCLKSWDGADSFIGFSQGSALPEPASLLLLGLGLAGVGVAAWRRKK